MKSGDGSLHVFLGFDGGFLSDGLTDRVQRDQTGTAGEGATDGRVDDGGAAAAQTEIGGDATGVDAGHFETVQLRKLGRTAHGVDQHPALLRQTGSNVDHFGQRDIEHDHLIRPGHFTADQDFFGVEPQKGLDRRTPSFDAELGKCLDLLPLREQGDSQDFRGDDRALSAAEIAGAAAALRPQMIPIRLHPNLPAGTLFAWAQNLPAYYQSANVPETARVQCRREYYQIPWPLVTRANETGVYAEEVLVCYAPFALGMITNIGNG